MRRRTRSLLGAILIVGFVPVYALAAMALAQGRPIQDAAPLVQGLIFAVLGLAWVLPVMPILKWMEKPDV